MPRRRSAMLLIGAVAILVLSGGAYAIWSPRGTGMVDESSLRTALNRKFKLPKDGRVEIGPTVPGLIVFHAYDAKQKVTGVFDGEIHVDFNENLPLVLHALGYGERAVDPQVVAGAIGMLEDNPGTPFLTQFAIDQSGDPAVMNLPKLVDVDGQQVVEYWNMTAQRPPWRSRVFRKPDGTFEVRQDLPGGR